MAVRELLTKQPFYRLVNGGREAQTYNKPQYVDQMKYTERRLMGSIMTQTDYLEEYYPFSHRVMSDFYFPEFYNYSKEVNEATGKEEIKFHREETLESALHSSALLRYSSSFTFAETMCIGS